MTFEPYDDVAVTDSVVLADIGKLIATTIQTIPGVEQTLTCLTVEI